MRVMQRPKKSPIAKLLALTLTFAMLLGIAITATAAPAYPDISGHWGETAIEKWSAYDVLHGNDLGTFEPDGELDVTQLAQILVNTFGYTESFSGTLPGYSSVWGEEEVRKAVAAGAIEAGEVALPLTRELAAKIVAKAFGIAPVSGASKFSDDYAISSEYRPYAAAVGRAGIFNGNDYGELMPADAFSRAQIMQALDNAVTDIVKESKAAESAKSVIINKGGVTLSEGVIEGDLIIAQGVGDGDITLDSVTVQGRLVIFGGGANSIHIKGKSNIASVLIAKTFGQAARLVVESADAVVGTVTIAAESKATVATTNNAAVSKVTIAPKTQVSATGELTDVTTAAAATVTISAKVENLAVETKAAVTVASGATITAATVEASDVKISGAGKLTAVTVTADAKSGVEIRTSGTKVTVDKDAGAVTTSSGKIEPGKTATTGSSSSSGGGDFTYYPPEASFDLTVGLSPEDADWSMEPAAPHWLYYPEVDKETGDSGIDAIAVDGGWIDGSDGYSQDEITVGAGAVHYFVKVVYSNYTWNDASALKLKLNPPPAGDNSDVEVTLVSDRFFHDAANKTIYYFGGATIATGDSSNGWFPNARFAAGSMRITASIVEGSTTKISAKAESVTWESFALPASVTTVPDGGFYEVPEGGLTVATGNTFTVAGTVTVPEDVELKVTGTLTIAGTVAVEEGAKITFDDNSKLSGTGTITVQEGGALVGSVTGVDAFWDGTGNTAKIVYGPGAEATLGTNKFIGTDGIVSITHGTVTQSKNKFTLDEDGVATIAATKTLRISTGDALEINGDLTVAGTLDVSVATVTGAGNLIIDATGILDAGGESQAQALFTGFTQPATPVTEGDAPVGVMYTDETTGATYTLLLGAKIIRETGMANSMTTYSLPEGYAFTEAEIGVYTLGLASTTGA